MKLTEDVTIEEVMRSQLTQMGQVWSTTHDKIISNEERYLWKSQYTVKPYLNYLPFFSKTFNPVKFFVMLR